MRAKTRKIAAARHGDVGEIFFPFPIGITRAEGYDLENADFFLKIFVAGASMHAMGMQDPTRARRDSDGAVEKKMDKVRWVLG